MAYEARIRIGELSRRVGVSPELLRAWETRYGLLVPERTAGGLRMYSPEDERRVVLMRRHIEAGLTAAEAARLAKLETEPTPDTGAATMLAEINAALQRAFDQLDEPGAHAAIDRLFTGFALTSAMTDLILPFLRRLGDRWAAGEVSVAHEHFASNVIGGRLRARARGWGQGVGPHAILACPPGEQHELGLLCFGLALRERGWRITYLGAETPLRDIAQLPGELTIAVLAGVSERPFADVGTEITELAKRIRVGIGGAGASHALADALGVEWLGDDLAVAAAELKP